MVRAVELASATRAGTALWEATKRRGNVSHARETGCINLDIDGQASCKTCPPGSKACNYYGVCSISDSGTYCTKCSAGSYEKEGECVSCTGPVQYQDEDGQTSCKSCPAGVKSCNAYGVCGPSSISDFGHTYCEEETSVTVPTLL